MTPRLKWTALGLLVLLVAAGGARTWTTRQAKQADLQARQVAQNAPATLTLASADRVQARTLDLTLELPISGPLKATQTAMVKARVAGELQDMTVREGDWVQAGQVLARVVSAEPAARLRQAQQQAQAAQAQVGIARRSVDNNHALVQQGFISPTALDTSTHALAAAQATYQAAAAGAQAAEQALQDTVLRAPITGQIAQRLAQPGERVGVDARVLEIVDPSHLELEAAINGADTLAVTVGQIAQLQVDGAPQALSARVVRLNPSTTAGTRAVLVYLAVDTTTPLRQGLFAQGTLATGMTRVLALPLSAVRTDKPQPYVQQVLDGQVTHHSVRLGQRGEVNGETWVAVQDLTEGDTVLSGRTGLVREGTPVTLQTSAL